MVGDSLGSRRRSRKVGGDCASSVGGLALADRQARLCGREENTRSVCDRLG